MLTLEFRQPPSLNDIINKCRTNKYAANQEKQRWTKYVVQQCRDNLVCFNEPCFIVATFDYWKDSSDADNLFSSIKYLLDGLTAAEILKKDNLTIVKKIYPIYQKIPQSSEKKTRLQISNFAEFRQLVLVDLEVLENEYAA